jgi:hypothetical protein
MKNTKKGWRRKHARISSIQLITTVLAQLKQRRKPTTMAASAMWLHRPTKRLKNGDENNE